MSHMGNSASNNIVVSNGANGFVKFIAGIPAPVGFATALVTAPQSSNAVTTSFGTSLTIGATGKQNTTGADVILTISLIVTVAASAVINLGVGSASSPTVNTAVPSFSTTGVVTLSVYVPTNYWVAITTSGTITVSSNTIVAMAV